MTHLHFDHCGGSVQWNKTKQDTNCFQKRQILSNHGIGYKTQSQGESIFLSENILPMQESGQLTYFLSKS
jgi:hypothetical protein